MRLVLVAMVMPLWVSAATYYVDAAKGRDGNAGTAEEKAWQTLEKVNATKLEPGDRVLLRAGGVWRGQLAPQGSGKDGSPVVIGSYGGGRKPRIDGEGRVEDVIRLYNVEHVEVRDLEITNRGETAGAKRGVHIVLDNFGTGRNIAVTGMYIHDINGTDEQKDNGGIVFRTKGDKTPSRFDGLRIEGNILWKVDRSGIVAQSYHWPRSKWNPSLRVVIRDNYLDDIGGDGIVPWATDGALVEHNIALRCNRRSKAYNAGIWPWSADNTLFQLNEAAYTRGTKDGQGFDSDYNSHNTVFQYNYSHENEGGFILICTPGERDARENAGNVGTIVRRNISRDDLERVFDVSAAERTLVENNAVYVGPEVDVQMLALTNWKGWARGLVFRGNEFRVEGKARYGHQVSRNEQGQYQIQGGWGGAEGVVFEGNKYGGRHVDAPAEAAHNRLELTPVAPKRWKCPEFDPSNPEGFAKFMQRHREWMLELMKWQFGSEAKLGVR